MVLRTMTRTLRSGGAFAAAALLHCAAFIAVTGCSGAQAASPAVQEQDVRRGALAALRKQADARVLILAESTFTIDRNVVQSLAGAAADDRERAALMNLLSREIGAVPPFANSGTDTTLTIVTDDLRRKWRAAVLAMLAPGQDAQQFVDTEGRRLEVLRKVTPGALGVVHLSPVGFAPDRKTAVQVIRLQCGFNCTEERLYVLEWRDAQWKVSRNMRVFVS